MQLITTSKNLRNAQHTLKTMCHTKVDFCKLFNIKKKHVEFEIHFSMKIFKFSFWLRHFPTCYLRVPVRSMKLVLGRHYFQIFGLPCQRKDSSEICFTAQGCWKGASSVVWAGSHLYRARRWGLHDQTVDRATLVLSAPSIVLPLTSPPPRIHRVNKPEPENISTSASNAI